MASSLSPADLSNMHFDRAPEPNAQIHFRNWPASAQALLELMPERVAVIDQAGIIVAINHGWRIAAGLGDKPPIELAQKIGIGADYLEICRSASKEAETRRMLTGLTSLIDRREGQFRDEYVCQTPLGRRLFTVEAHFLSFDKFNGVLIRHTDITEKTESEIELIRLSEAVRQSREPTAFVDNEQIFVYVNPAFEKLFGYNFFEIVGCHKSRLLPDDPIIREVNLIPPGTEFAGERLRRAKSGRLIQVHIRVGLIKDNAGHVIGQFGSYSDLTDIKATEEHITYLGSHDKLTGLPNRNLLTEMLRQSLSSTARTGYSSALLFLDIDRFKVLNETYSHKVGDEILIQVAEKISLCLRAVDFVARFGGDEFVILLENIHENIDDAVLNVTAVARRLLNIFTQPFDSGMHQHYLTASIGAALFDNDENSVADLLKRSEMAMYQAKEGGRNDIYFFEPVMEREMFERSSLELELRQAIATDQITLYYQLQVDASGTPQGVEALVRWHHPVRGVISPAYFIPLAEETGLIHPLGQTVLSMACRQISAWKSIPAMRELTIAVNVSAKEFAQKTFVDQVISTLEEHNIDPRNIKLELTESMLVQNLDETIDKMFILKHFGINFSLDDFGTGYSSLSYLKRLPLSQLKIDQSFVRDIVTNSSDAMIARTIIALANNFSLQVIAEGVETEAQRSHLAEMGCRHYQGYLFGRPVSGPELTAKWM